MCHNTTFVLDFVIPVSAFAAFLFTPPAASALSNDILSTPNQLFEHEDTRQLVSLVSDAARLTSSEGEAAFAEFRTSGSRWRQGDMYIFVLDRQGNMLVHPDPAMEGNNQLQLKDINGKPIVQGLIAAATSVPDKTAGWYHYEWPVPDGVFPRWKSSYVQSVTAPSGKSYIVGSGVYNDRMERSFVIDEVKSAVAQIEKNGSAAFNQFHDPTGPYIAKDAYIFVLDASGVELVNPAFPNLEGRNLLHQKDTQDKEFVRDMLSVVETSGSGWVDYMWPKPGESVSTQKSTYVSKAKMGNKWVLVGCGVYLADAPKVRTGAQQMTAPQLMALVRDSAAILEKQGEKAYPEFRTKGSTWFGDDTYLFVVSMDGTRVFHAANPSLEGKKITSVQDILGRPYGKRMLERASGPSGEGWVHYMYPKPGDIFPAWKSTFVKQVTLPNGQNYFVGCGIYDMQMDKALIEDVVDRAAHLIATQGKDAFPQFRDKTGPFYFMDTYLFVLLPDGTELVNPVVPSLEGKNILNLKDLNGRAVIRDEINAAMTNGSAWLDVNWYTPGQNTPARKQTYVRKVQVGQDTYIVGSGVYMD